MADKTPAELIEAAKAKAPKFTDYERGKAQPEDGDLCMVKVFDTSKGRAEAGALSIYDDHRGVFFKSPEFGGGGSVVGPRRDNYKAERVPNVVAFAVIVPSHDPAPEPDSIIDHRAGIEHASSKPPQVRTPAAPPE